MCARVFRRRRASYVTSRSGVASRGRVGPSQRAHVPKRGSGGTLSQHLNYLKIRQEHQEPSRGCFPRLAEQLNSSLTGAVTTPDYRGEEEVGAFTASDADSLTRWRGAENVAGTCGINSRRAAGSWANPEPATRQATYQRGRTVSERRKSRSAANGCLTPIPWSPPPIGARGAGWPTGGEPSRGTGARWGRSRGDGEHGDARMVCLAAMATERRAGWIPTRQW